MSGAKRSAASGPGGGRPDTDTDRAPDGGRERAGRSPDDDGTVEGADPAESGYRRDDYWRQQQQDLPPDAGTDAPAGTGDAGGERRDDGTRA